MFTRNKARIVLSLAVLTACPAMAETAEYFGHRISIEDGRGKDSGSQTLQVDGKDLASADHVFVEKSGIVGDVNVVVTALHTGGSFCSPQSALVVFVKDKPPQLIAPNTDCRDAEVGIGKDRVTFTVAPRPSRDGMKAIWTHVAGLAPSETIVFQPDPEKSWSNLQASRIDHPADLFRFADIGAQLRNAIGQDFAEAIEIVDGTGSGEFKGDVFVGTSFKPHYGVETGALVVADIPSRRVFVAWKAQDKKIVVRPAVADWPRPARLELKQWAKPWYGAANAGAAEAPANAGAVVRASLDGGVADAAQTASIVGAHFDALHGVYKGEQGEVLDHNGSWVWLFPRAGLIVYNQPKASIADVVRKGDILFRGEIGRRAVRGTAYVFKSGCEPLPYAVQGNGFDGNPNARVVLRGAAPVRARQGCAVIGTTTSSGNAALVFRGQGEIGD